MLDLFRVEVETHTGTLSEAMLELEENPRAADQLEAAMRAAHSIKGAARVVNVHMAVKIAHAIEDVFVAAQSGKVSLIPGDFDVLLKGLDTLSNLGKVSEADLTHWQEEKGAEIEELIKATKAILTKTPEERGDTKVPDIAAPDTEVKAAVVKVAEDKIVAKKDIDTKVVQAEPIQPSPKETEAIGKLSGFDKRHSDRDPHKGQAEKGHFVRVTSENLNTLMGLAGEYIVEARWLRPFADCLQREKTVYWELSKLLDKIQETNEKVDKGGKEIPFFNQAKFRLNECRINLADRINDFEEYARRTENLSNRLYREVISCRMRPFSDGVSHFPRLVRDMARKLNKKIKFEIRGKSTEVDRDILQKLEAPLNHMIRNSVDHGIESPAERVEAGKPEIGNLTVSAFHRAGMLSITIEDDGHGLDLGKLKEKILSKNLSEPETVARLTEGELIDFLFLPGFSTASKVTEISGRGVGLDVVRAMLHEVGGVVRAESTRGKGITFHLQLPLTLSMIRTLLVEIGGEPYAFPLSRIQRSLTLNKEEIEVLEGREYFSFDGEHIGLVMASSVLGVKSDVPDSKEVPVIVIANRSDQFGIIVDKYLGERQLVVRPNDPRLGKVQDISASALMSDGSPVLIIDVEDFVQSIANLLSGENLKRAKTSEVSNDNQNSGSKKVLVVEDSITVRETERKILEENGYRVDLAVDGMDGWNATRTGKYDLIISDIDMPRMNGFELVTQIKNDVRLKKIPIIICSYKNREEDEKRGLACGADIYLNKGSIYDKSFIEAISSLIGAGKS
ncbi:response regulator [Candidatus Riflebacteria bacterium]